MSYLSLGDPLLTRMSPRKLFKRVFEEKANWKGNENEDVLFPTLEEGV